MGLFEMLPQVGGVAGTVAAFLVVLGVVVFVHEYGHYIVGRWCGIHAEVFSIGFGREIFGWVDKRGTRWRVAVLPLGGYVKFLGDADAASARPDDAALARMSSGDRSRSFPDAALWRRALTVAAGPAFNFALAIVIYAVLAGVLGMGSDRPVVGVRADAAPEIEALREGDEILAVAGTEVRVFADIQRAYDAAAEETPGREVFPVALRRDGRTIEVETGPLVPPVVGSVAQGAPAERAGLRPGDRILSVDGAPVASFSDLQRSIRASGERPVTLALRDPGGVERAVTLEPKLNPAPTPGGGIELRPLIGVTAVPLIGPESRTPGPIEAVGHGVERTWQVISASLTYVGAIVTGRTDASGLGGPIRIATLSGDAAASGLVTFIGMIALISASIGMINLFPIPVLDGGHLVFYAVEAVRGKPVGEKVQEAATAVGLGLVLMLMVFVTWNDIVNL